MEASSHRENSWQTQVTLNDVMQRELYESNAFNSFAIVHVSRHQSATGSSSRGEFHRLIGNRVLPFLATIVVSIVALRGPIDTANRGVNF